MTKKTETSRTIGNIKKCIAKSINKYNGGEKEVDKLLKIHGLDTDRLDFVGNVTKMIENEKAVSDMSIDANSNKEGRNIEALLQEGANPIKKLVGFDALYRQSKKLFGKEEAQRLSGEMYNLSLAISDSTQIMKVYCWALNTSPLLLEGKTWGGSLKSKPSKRMSSYVAVLSDMCHVISQRIAGAEGIADLFVCLSALSYRDNFYDVLGDEYVENCLQQFIYSINNVSRASSESPFINVSLFDKIKLKKLIEDHYHLFPEDFNVDDAVEVAFHFQDIYMKIMTAGDPLKDGMPFKFPITTLNLQENDDSEIIDVETLKKWCDRDISRYNIFSSKSQKVASCCRLLSDAEMFEEAGNANSMGGGGSISLGSHRVVTVNFPRIAMETNSKEQYFELLKERVESASKILKSHKELLKDLETKGLQELISVGVINMRKLFSTIGINGIAESSEISGIPICEILEFLNGEMSKCSKKYDILINGEELPGETMAVRLASADKLFWNHDFKLYSNQFVSLWDKSSVKKRMSEFGKYNNMLTGGGICSITVGEDITPTQAFEGIVFASKAGCEHFSFIMINSECENNHVRKGRHMVCPECGGKIVEYWQKIVGYMSKVSDWNPVRREYDFELRHINKIK